MKGNLPIVTGLIASIGMAFLISAPPIFAGPISDHYELRSFGFGAGSAVDATSGSYSLNAAIGELNAGNLSGESYKVLNPGVIFTQQANIPPPPAFTNPGSAYNRLKIILETGGNPTDATYAVAITDNNWETTYYIQNDFTMGTQLGSEDWMDHETWNTTVGMYITGLRSSTPYAVKVKARTGDFTESGWSGTSTAATVAPSLTFSVSADTIRFDPLTPDNDFTDSGKSTTITTSTNAYNGYSVYARETGPLMDTHGNSINDYGSPNSAPTVWSNTGFGYTTSDTNLAGDTPERFTSGGPKYAGFTLSNPGDPVADHVGTIVESPVVDEVFTISYRVKTEQTKQAGIYQNTIIYTVVPEY